MLLLRTVSFTHLRDNLRPGTDVGGEEHCWDGDRGRGKGPARVPVSVLGPPEQLSAHCVAGNTRNPPPHGAGGQRSDIKVWAGLHSLQNL